MTYKYIIYEKKDRIAFITLNRPNVLNAINKQLFQELNDALCDYRDDSDVWVCILNGAGSKAFSSGHDLKEDTEEEFQEAWKTGYWKPKPPTIYEDLGIMKPLIAAVHGYCLAGGLEIALACDIRIAAENTQFGLAEVLRSLIPSGGGTLRLPRMIPMGLAMELLFTGDVIDAREAHRIGLVNKVVPFSELMPTAEKLARRICENGPLAVQTIKELAMRGLDMPLQQGFRLTTNLEFINHLTQDSMEGPRAFIEKRKPKYKGK